MKPSDKDPNSLRLQVFLSRNGVCSRRQAFDIIQEGRVGLNGRICREPSTPVDPHKDRISVDGKRVERKGYDYVLLNKPAGYITTRADRFAQKTVLDLLPREFRHLAPAGRLDQDTEGLLLLTNDGDAAYRLTHPKFNVDKTYFVRISGRLEAAQKDRLEKGIMIEGKKTFPSRITDVKVLKDQTELMITIHEGRKRQIRIMFARIGHQVIYLKRIIQGPLVLGALKVGKWRSLTQKEMDSLRKL